MTVLPHKQAVNQNCGMQLPMPRIDASAAVDYFVERFWLFAVDDPGCDWRSGAGTTVPGSSLPVVCEAGGRRS